MKKNSEPADPGSIARRNRLVRLIIVIGLLIALPVTIYILREQQILRSGAASVTMSFADPANPNTPITSTSNPNVLIKMVYGDTGTTATPTPTPFTGTITPTPTTGSTAPTNTPVPGNPTLSLTPSSFRLGDQLTLSWSNLPNNCICFIDIVFPETTVGGIFTGHGNFKVSLPNDTGSSCVLQPQNTNLAGYSPTSGSCSFTLSQSRFDNLAWSYLDSYTQPVTAEVVLRNYIGSEVVGTFGTVTLLP